MKITIAIQNNKGAEDAERMGFKFEPKIDYEEFYFRPHMLESMWHDKIDNELVLGINGCDYRTPYTPELFESLKEIIES